MPLDWNEKAFDDHYNIRIRWHGPTDPSHPDFDPLNTGTLSSRIGERVNYGLDFARYSQRDGRFGTGNVDNARRTPFMFYARRGALLAQALTALGGITPATSRIMLVGSEYGYTLHGLKNASRHELISDDYPETYGMDNSTYIETNLPAQQVADDGNIVFDDVLNAGTVDGNIKLTTVTGGTTFNAVLNGVIESFNLEGITTELIGGVMTATGTDAGLATAELAALNAHLDACETLLTGVDNKYIINLIDTPLLPDATGDEEQYDFLNSYGTTLRTLENWKAIRPSHSWLDIHNGVLLVGGV